ncbi:uncharacterized protein LOC100832630 [Brachypodium distachyon]|uniref:Uncharacterized protein n=1 Tax=Brachypodium distachyon TaxID=15368 RepID=I1HU47_BRADI|nr:uncharacterized protein LOC100832630 [Brachypodium distachyon]KQK10965.1 hypothetical protein BRADI_2g57340v3 [Brachypodium distachyon]|eukprot:XP_003564811.1 uncharacterized protein LOC100832630 [Brachypodium distachyon]
MEGLIPFICKAIKERRTRSYSRCSSDNGGSPFHGFGAAVDDDNKGVWDWERKQLDGAAARKADGGVGGAHRRHRSLEELAGEVGAGAPEHWRPAGAMRRGRSVRIFSCIGGM